MLGRNSRAPMVGGGAGGGGMEDKDHTDRKPNAPEVRYLVVGDIVVVVLVAAATSVLPAATAAYGVADDDDPTLITAFPCVVLVLDSRLVGEGWATSPTASHFATKITQPDMPVIHVAISCVNWPSTKSSVH